MNLQVAHIPTLASTASPVAAFPLRSFPSRLKTGELDLSGKPKLYWPSESLSVGNRAVAVPVRFSCIGTSVHNPVVVLHPALTGNAEAWVSPEERGSQGRGWYSEQFEAAGLLDRRKFTTICFDHLASPTCLGDAQIRERVGITAQELCSIGAAAQTRLQAQCLVDLGIQKVHAVVGASVGAAMALHWALQDLITVERIIDLSGPSQGNPCSFEFFQLQRDFLTGQLAARNFQERLRANLETAGILGNGWPCPTESGMLTAWELIQRKIQSLWKETQDGQAERLRIVRMVGFLRFVGPTYFNKILQDGQAIMAGDVSDRPVYAKDWQRPADCLASWFERQAKEFEARFSSESLAALLELLSGESCPKPQALAQNVVQAPRFYSYVVEGDTLFPGSTFYRDLNALGLPVQHHHVADVRCGHDNFLQTHFPGQELREKWLEDTAD